MTTPTPDDVLRTYIMESYKQSMGKDFARQLLELREAVRKFLRFAPSHPSSWIRGVDKAELTVGQREFFTLIANLPEHQEGP